MALISIFLLNFIANIKSISFYILYFRCDFNIWNKIVALMMEKFKIKFQYGITNKIQINNCQNESLNLIPSNFI